MATDAPDAVEKASYSALNGAFAAPIKVYQHPPDNADTTNGLVEIGEITVDDEQVACKDDQDRQLTLTIVTIRAGRERKPLLAMQATVDRTLDKLTVVEGSWRLNFIAKSSNATRGKDDNGDYYLGLNEFTVLAFGT